MTADEKEGARRRRAPAEQRNACSLCGAPLRRGLALCGRCSSKVDREDRLTRAEARAVAAARHAARPA